MEITDKKKILTAVIDQLEQEWARLHQADMHSSASAMQSAARAEKQRDTTGLEAAYLAHGYARQTQTLERQLEELKGLALDDFCGQEIDLGALVGVELSGEPTCCFILPYGGGLEVEVNGRTIDVITPEAPLGSALMGNVEAGSVKLSSGVEGIILDVC